MDPDLVWNQGFKLDIDFGYMAGHASGPGHFNPKLVLNDAGSTVEHALVEELRRARQFTFSVAFISAGAVAQLKQHFLDFKGEGRIVTSDFLGFNRPTAFAELLNLGKQTGIDVRIHRSEGFHPKGYVFSADRNITAIVGSSNLTSAALSQNHEWNLRVSAAQGSDLADQFETLIAAQVEGSIPLTQEWIDEYAKNFVEPPSRVLMRSATSIEKIDGTEIRPNAMQQDALLAIDLVRAEGHRRAIIISATGTGKTMLSALDVRAASPSRMLFIAHREQILDRTIEEYQRALDVPALQFGKLTGSHKQQERQYVFATIQTLAQDEILQSIESDAFEYIIIDEAHRAGADTYRRVIDHFRPKFLLGMTATPERTDGFNVFELFHYNVPYEIRLNEALEADMLSPFHYYGISDVEYSDGTTTSDTTTLGKLTSPERVEHIVRALETYGQAGVPPRGLMFCGDTKEANSLSALLNNQDFRGRKLRTVSLTGADSVELREQRVKELEQGNLDYILTVDIFNEGVDIPTVNQVVMLRQTQSAIVFVQQLGRGLRRAQDKDYLVVIDVIGNYSSNFLIPIALFGDDTLNREVLRERLNETVESGALPGLSSVNFDEVSRARVLQSISQTKLDSMQRLKSAVVAMSNRVGGVPALWDFFRFGSVDPVVLATAKPHYPALVEAFLQVDSQLTQTASQFLSLLSQEVLPAKRIQEFALFELLLKEREVTYDQIAKTFWNLGIADRLVDVKSAVDTFTLDGYSQTDVNRYVRGIAERNDVGVRLSPPFNEDYEKSETLRIAISDLLRTGIALTRERYDTTKSFTPGIQYTRRDAARILGWSRATASTIYGYKTDQDKGVCAIFVTLHKSSEVGASTAYGDELVDPTSMRWFSRSNRSLASTEVAAIVNRNVVVHVFAKKSDAEGSDHYYLGEALPHDAVETSMPDDKGKRLPVVQMLLKFKSPIRQGLFDYLHSGFESDR
jgi:superfamily II DNA or RNA helicase/HKD family nuclease